MMTSGRENTRRSHSVSIVRSRNSPMWKKADGTANTAANFVILEDSKLVAMESVLFDEVWILDTRSSFHVTSNKEWFLSYKSGDFGVVYQVDGVP